MKAPLLLAFVRLAFAVCLGVATPLATRAATHTVDNANPGAADFSDLATAIGKAASGDTLLLAGSATSYGTAKLDKELHLIGPGWNIKENHPDATPATGASIDLLTIDNSNASGSSLTSLRITSISLSNTADILVQRIRPVSETQDATVSVSMLRVSSATLRQNFRLAIAAKNGEANISKLKVLNNIVASQFRLNATDAQIEHNLILDGPVDISGASLRYNLLYPGSNTGVTLANSLAEFNVAAQSASKNADRKGFWPGNNNLNDADADSLFVAAGSFDSQFQLGPKSPAANIANTGLDVGPFGGGRPYILSGMPSVPVIFQVNAPATAERGETINISFNATTEPVESSSSRDPETD